MKSEINSRLLWSGPVAMTNESSLTQGDKFSTSLDTGYCSVNGSSSADYINSIQAETRVIFHKLTKCG